MACLDCEPLNKIITPMTVVPCDTCNPVVACKTKHHSSCIVYNHKDVTTPSGLQTLGLPNGSNLTVILDKIDTMLSQTYQPIILDAFRQVSGITGTNVSLQTLLNALQQHAIVQRSQDQFVKINASDSTSGYLDDKLVLDACLIKNTVVTNGVSKIKITLDFNCILDKINSNTSTKAKFANLVSQALSSNTTGGCDGISTSANWQEVGTVRCNGNIQEKLLRDINVCSNTYNQTKWVDTGDKNICRCNGLSTSATWSDTGSTRCVDANLEKQQKDLNSCSNTFNQVRWTLQQVNSSACSVPCYTYRIKNESGVSASITYKDCNDVLKQFALASGQTTNICAKRGSLNSTSAYTVTELSQSCGTSDFTVPTTPAPQNVTPTPSPTTPTPVTPTPTTPTPVTPTPTTPTPTPTTPTTPTPSGNNVAYYSAGQSITMQDSILPNYLTGIRYSYDNVFKSLTIDAKLNPSTANVAVKVQLVDGSSMTLGNAENSTLSENTYYGYKTINDSGYTASWTYAKGTAGTGVPQKMVRVSFILNSDSSSVFAFEFYPEAQTNITLF